MKCTRAKCLSRGCTIYPKENLILGESVKTDCFDMQLTIKIKLKQHLLQRIYRFSVLLKSFDSSLRLHS